MTVPNVHHLGYVVAGHVGYEKYAGRSGSFVRVDPPRAIMDTILAMGPSRELQPLKGSSSTPLVLRDGTLVTEPGYDPVSQLYLFDSPALREIEVPKEPTLTQCRFALEKLWWPFRMFPFAGDVDRGVMLAALLTAVTRQAMETAPMFAFDAPTRGSGKTLLAESLSLLAGDNGGTMPPVFGNEEEVRKRMTANVMAGVLTSITDNVRGIVRSVVLAQALTSGQYRDRVLGASEIVNLPYRVLEMITGNNVVVGGDLARRVVVCRIDPEMEKAFTRSFPFNPKDFIREDRMDMVQAALTLIRGAMLWQGRTDVGALASFDEWNEIVRKTVVFADQVVRWEADPGFGDPVDSINDVYENDTEQDAHALLLKSLKGMFPGGQLFSASDIVDRLPSKHATPVGAVKQLVDALSEICGGEKEWNARIIGNRLKYRKDTIVGGLCLKQVKKVDDIWKWKVVEVDETGAEKKLARRRA